MGEEGAGGGVGGLSLYKRAETVTCWSHDVMMLLMAMLKTHGVLRKLSADDQ